MSVSDEEAHQQDGSSMCHLARSCLSWEWCMNLTRGQSPMMWEREMTRVMFCPPCVDNDHADCCCILFLLANLDTITALYCYTNLISEKSFSGSISVSQSHNIITTIILSFSTSLSVFSDFSRGTKTEFGSDFILKTKSNFDFWPFVASVPCKNQK